MSQEILKKYKIKAKKNLGQNFLVNEKIISEISDIILVKNKNIVEVGPGYGALTEKLLEKRPNSLELVELDSDMVNILEDRINSGDLDLKEVEFKINKIDVLKYKPKFKNYDVIANIPYYITSPILRHFLYELENIPDNMIILMQKDVGDKILKKNKNKSSVLSLIIEKKAFVFEKLFVGKENFIPAPKVESSVLLFEIHNLYKNIDDEKFLKIIKIGFAQSRKKLIKNLINGGFDKNKILDILINLGYGENVRAEDLDIKDWCELVESL